MEVKKFLMRFTKEELIDMVGIIGPEWLLHDIATELYDMKTKQLLKQSEEKLKEIKNCRGDDVKYWEKLNENTAIHKRIDSLNKGFMKLIN